MHLIVYTSRYTGRIERINSVLSVIKAKSVDHNIHFKITGTLFFYEGYFLQFVEGIREDVETFMSKIEKDSRHADIVRIVDEEIKERSFSGWTMEFLNLDEVDDLDMDLLLSIRDIYKRNYTMDSKNLTLFFKMVFSSYSKNGSAGLLAK